MGALSGRCCGQACFPWHSWEKAAQQCSPLPRPVVPVPLWGEGCSQGDSAAPFPAFSRAKRLLLPWSKAWGRKWKGAAGRGWAWEGPFPGGRSLCFRGGRYYLENLLCGSALSPSSFQLRLCGEKGFSKFALAFPETSIEASVFLP